ncbi:MAG: bifunctional DNA primase/helicase, partial [Mojavia pulchra JT2-VF2]|nr:bifunctional DNA primase/helicase [Mojavia pulchra JT2-VF2]
MPLSPSQSEVSQKYPNNLTAVEYHELAVGSAIHPALIERNFFHIEGESVYDYLFISDKIPRKNAGRVTDAYIKMYQHLLVGGTWIGSLDPFKNWQPMEWGRIKPNFPRIDWDKGKPVKYESPPKTANRVTYFDVANPVWDLVARRYNIKRYHSLLALR